MTIKPGQLYWAIEHNRIPHPFLILEVNSESILVCKVTTNQNKAHLPGNIILDAGEGNLAKASILDVADVSEKSLNDLGEYIGTLDIKRVAEVKQGMNFLKRSYLFRT